MALTESNKTEQGSTAPDFCLSDVVSEKELSVSEVKGQNGLVVMFICNHCPYVIHIEDKLVEIAEQYKEKGVGFAAICSNDAGTYPADSPVKMKERALEKSFPFPYLVDESQEIAKLYKAACTPDIYLYDKDLALYYHGQFDSSRPGSGEATGVDLTDSLDSLLNNQPAPAGCKPSIGCNIKWK